MSTIKSRSDARQLTVAGEWTILHYAEWIAEKSGSSHVEAEARLDGETLPEIALWITDSGAATDEIYRGIGAAKELLAARGIPAVRAWLAAAIDANGATAVTADLNAWNDAETAAFEAAFAGWARRPEGALLGLA